MDKEEKHKKAILIVMLCFLFVVAGVLSLLIVANTNNNGDSIGDSQETEAPDFSSATIEYVVDYYQAKIDGTSDNNEKINLYDIRLKTIIEKDENREHIDQVIADAISIDDIEQSASSALQVCGYASYFGEQVIYDEYYSLYEERQAASGPTTEGRG